MLQSSENISRLLITFNANCLEPDQARQIICLFYGIPEREKRRKNMHPLAASKQICFANNLNPQRRA